MSIRAQYERWPYPDVSLWASVPASELTQLRLEHLCDRSGVGPPPARPRIWIAGCGTFQPYVWGIANPQAEILASDLSENSLRRARWRCGLHGVRNVQFSQVDLQESLPEGPFDYIECYGVLMNLRDPGATLAAMATRLASGGVLRVMVYPWFSRRRIFQIQRVARLLGLVPPAPGFPARLRALIRALPVSHPLRYAFDTYADAQNDAGLVDGFLHVGDRGFTAPHLLSLVQQAGLRPAFWFHRPWAQPARLAEALQWDAPDADLLHHADLWQELRGNFVVCLRRSDAPTMSPVLRWNPALQQTWRMRAGKWLGLNLGSRLTDERIHLTAPQFRMLDTWISGGPPPDSALQHLAWEGGLVLGGPPSHRTAGPGEVLEPPIRLERGKQAANPFYDHLFAAWRASDPDLEVRRWGDFGETLEDSGEWGLTPLGSWAVHADAIRRWKRESFATAEDFSALRYAGEEAGIAELKRWLSAFDLPRKQWESWEERELWILLGSYNQLFLDTVDD